MSYQVLARKWRPRNFHEMVGQEHVLKALVNGLDRQQLHHAYLFTGTRGVGKTSIARILAKCLNCEKGVSSTPCGECQACVEISEGRFVDLIEVDAASRTKVEDTRDLLDNVQYAPTAGRYKVYLIDEVHMLSTHSFNALLKTLEEPPPHVKFLLATTDPQRLPATILSRCLQFNLKNLSAERIVEHLRHILDEEKVIAEEAGLWGLGRAANGSMRDALSLTDQAIAFGSGELTETDVRALLGTIDNTHIHDMLRALISADGKRLLQLVATLSEYAPDYMAALDELLALLHRVAIAQAVPGAVDNSQGDQAVIEEFASQLPPEDLQLFYQVGISGKRDLAILADQQAGFEMLLLRMLAFKPEGVLQVPKSDLPNKAGSTDSKTEKSDPAPVPAAREAKVSAKKPEVAASPGGNNGGGGTQPLEANDGDKEARPTVAPARSNDQSLPKTLEQLNADGWITLFAELPLNGVEKAVASHCVITACEKNVITFQLDNKHATLYSKVIDQRLQKALKAYFGVQVEVKIKQGSPKRETPAAFHQRIESEQQQQAIETIRQDPNIKTLVEQFAGQLDESSIRPLVESGETIH
jgi:DNA polymerase-3 subunit gamma/tau